MQLKNILIPGSILVTSFVFFTCGQFSSNDHHGDMMNNGHMGGSSMMDRQNPSQGNGGMMGGGMQGPQGGISNERQGPAALLDRSKTRQRAVDYLESTGNTAYLLGDGTERSNTVVYPVLRQADSSRVATLIVDRRTGQVQTER